MKYHSSGGIPLDPSVASWKVAVCRRPQVQLVGVPYDVASEIRVALQLIAAKAQPVQEAFECRRMALLVG